ncbi:MAG: SoxR reducing system RseC family protein [Zoogloeaceae bacterium]|jgi:sigma-E factor negative regulatory protein RseC|nr:SoxR reducing system RseC family protein [Zoogloeaceae bacterium]
MQTESESIVHATVMTVHNGKATVQLEKQADGGCAHGSACGIGRLTRWRDAAVLEVNAPPGLQAGDSVRLLAPQSGLPRLALLGYVWPSFALLLGAAFGHFLDGDSLAAFGALVFFLLAQGATRFAVAHRPAFCSLAILPFSDTESRHEH